MSEMNQMSQMSHMILIGQMCQKGQIGKMGQGMIYAGMPRVGGFLGGWVCGRFL